MFSLYVLILDFGGYSDICVFPPMVPFYDVADLFVFLRSVSERTNEEWRMKE